MRLQHLAYFIQVAECGSISRAAKSLYLKQSNLSNCIASLEEEFHTTLFTRTSKGVFLTPNGEKVLQWANRTLSEYKALTNSFTLDEKEYFPASHINFYISNSINTTLYSDMFRPMFQKFPETSFQIEEKGLDESIDAILNNPFSVGVGIFPEPIIESVRAIPELIFLPTSPQRLVIYTAKNSMFAKNYKTISLKTLFTLPIVLYSTTENSTIREVLAPYGALKSNHITNNINLFYFLLDTGKYITIGVSAPSGPVTVNV